MKRIKEPLILGLVCILLFATAGMAQRQGQESYTGIVTASQMASTGLSGLGLWEKRLNCHGQADCDQRLVRAGGKYVLLTNKGVLKLNDQAKAAQFVAQRVTVTGAFDSSKKTIEVAEVQPYKPSSTTAGVQ